MRNFNTKELSREALEQTYEIVLTQKVCLEAKIDRLIKEFSVNACAIEDGAVIDMNQVRQGFLNLIAYAETKIDITEELKPNLKAMELVNNHVKKLKAFHIARGKKIN